MFEINENASHREILLFIRSLPRYEVAALCVFITNNFEVSIPSYASKDTMIEYLRDMEKEVLLEALEAIFGTDAEEEDLDEAEEDDCDEDEDQMDEIEAVND